MKLFKIVCTYIKIQDWNNKNSYLFIINRKIEIQKMYDLWIWMFLKFPFHLLRNYETKILFSLLKFTICQTFMETCECILLIQTKNPGCFVSYVLWCVTTTSQTIYSKQVHHVYPLFSPLILTSLAFDDEWILQKIFSRKITFMHFRYAVCILTERNDVRSFTHNHHSSN